MIRKCRDFVFLWIFYEPTITQIVESSCIRSMDFMPHWVSPVISIYVTRLALKSQFLSLTKSYLKNCLRFFQCNLWKILNTSYSAKVLVTPWAKSFFIPMEKYFTVTKYMLLNKTKKIREQKFLKSYIGLSNTHLSNTGLPVHQAEFSGACQLEPRKDIFFPNK